MIQYNAMQYNMIQYNAIQITIQYNRSHNPSGWAVQKDSVWREDLNKHVLQLDQVNRMSTTISAQYQYNITIISVQYHSNIVTRIIFQGGILNYKEESVWYMTPTSQTTDVSPLEILHISGMLGIWVIGCGLGVLVFIIEILTGKGG